MMGYRRWLAAVMVASSSVAAVSSTANAAASEGALVLKRSSCASFMVPGDQLCETLRIVSNTARALSGHISVTNHVVSTAVYTDENGVYQWTASQNERGHLLALDGQAIEESYFFEELSNMSGMDCSRITRLHTTNGNVQYDEIELVCTPLP